MAGYPRDLAAHAPCRSLADVRLDLRIRRYGLLLDQMAADEAGNRPLVIAIDREIDAADARLRAVEAEIEARPRR